MVHFQTRRWYDYYPTPSATQDQEKTWAGGDTIRECVDDAASNPHSICLVQPTGTATATFLFATNYTIPSHIKLVVLPGAQISVNAAKSVTINGDIDAGLYKIFTGSGTTKVKKAYPHWWGAKFDGSNDDASAIQAAIDSVNAYGSGVVYLPGGTGYIGTTPLTLRHKVRIIGEGRDISNIQYTGTGTSFALSTDTDTQTTDNYIGLEGFTLDSNGSGIKLFQAQYGIHRDLEINFNKLGTASSSVGIQLEGGSWENLFSGITIQGNDENGRYSTKGIYQLQNGGNPNINRFIFHTLKKLHYGMYLDSGYDTAIYGSRFSNTRYHYYLGPTANRTRSIGSSHEENDGLQKALSFTSGGTYTISAGDTITGSSSGAQAYVANVERTSGTWTSGSAAGWLYIANQSGTYTAEDLNVGTNTNVATISGTSTLHYVLAKIDADNDQSAILLPSILTGNQYNIHDYSGKTTYTSGDGRWYFNGSTTGLNKILTTLAQSIDFGTITANSVKTATATVTGASIGDSVAAVPNGDVGSGLVWSARISAVDTVQIRVANPTTSNIGSNQVTWKIMVTQF